MGKGKYQLRVTQSYEYLNLIFLRMGEKTNIIIFVAREKGPKSASTCWRLPPGGIITNILSLSAANTLLNTNKCKTCLPSVSFKLKENAATMLRSRRSPVTFLNQCRGPM